MAKSLVEIIAGMEAELSELKALQKRLESVGQQLVGDQTLTKTALTRGDLFSGDKINIHGTFGIGFQEDHARGDQEAGVYTVELVEPDHYGGCLTVHLKGLGWIEFETIAKEVGISIVH